MASCPSTQLQEVNRFNIVKENQVYEASELLCAALEYLEGKLEINYFNEHQEDWDSPFRNTGAEYKNDTFSVSSFHWETYDDGYFIWRDYKVAWYKDLGRGTYTNKEMTPDIINQMLEECVESLH